MQLGAFELIRVLGRGGMGEVWAARHRDGWPAAVKVLTSDAAKVPAFRFAFQAEVRAVAGLNHPAIVAVYDRGQVEQGGELPEGSPYLVMERGTGTLRAVLGELEWSALRETLLTILDALAHAHARGILHRDLKPSNLLRMQDGTLRLTDFGLVFPMMVGERPEWSITAGTPSYMAPEQILGHWRDWGPSTDLYAFGCLAWALSAGEPPFANEPADMLYERHLSGELPKLRPAHAVGEGFDAWLHRLLQKAPEDRYSCAADAAEALARDVGVRPTVPAASRVAIPDDARDVTVTVVTTGAPRTAAPRPPSSASGLVPLPRYRAKVPSSWRRGLRSSRGAFPRGVGLGIYGLRALSLVGRQAERNQIWRALREVDREQAPRAVTIRGASGTGKSRLVEWIAERATELGAATWLRATHEPVQAAADGLVGMARRAIAAGGLGVEDRRHRVRTWVRRVGADVDGLQLERLYALTSDSIAALRSVEDRFAAVSTFLGCLAIERPVILVCDDIQWGRETFDFVVSMLRDARLPVLVLLTAREESLDVQLAERLAALDAVHLTLGPLDDAAQHELVQQMLGLGPELAAEVAQRAGGNPLFAVQLVGDWVQRGVLVDTGQGFARRSDVSVDIPDDLHAIWAARMDFALQGDPGSQHAAELAAALGVEVHWDELRAAAGLGEEVARDLAERLADAQLVVGSASGFAFVHGLLRESLERTAREGGRWQGHHRAIAAALETLGAPKWRLGLHCLEAGRYDDAVEFLLAGATELAEAVAPRRIRALMSSFERAADGAGLPPEDPRRTRAGLFSALAMLNEHTQAAIDACRAIEAAARAAGLPSEEADAIRIQAEGLSRGGHLREAVAEFRRALAVGAAAPQWKQQVNCLNSLGLTLLYLGDLEEAREAYLECEMVAGSRNDWVGLSGALIGLGLVAFQGRQYESARRFVLQAIESVIERAGSARLLLACYNTLGEIARAEGDLDAARRSYEETIRLARGSGYIGEATAEGNLGHVEMAAGRFPEAKACLERAVRAMDATGHVRMAQEFRAALLAVHAALADWASFDEVLAEIEASLSLESFAAVDVAHSTMLAGNLCREAGERDRAHRMWTISRAQFTALRAEEEVQMLEVLLAEL